MRNQFSSFDVAVVVYELQKTILDCRVRNIYQVGDNTLLLKLRKHNGHVFRLVLESGKRLHLTSYSREKPKLPPAFCMALRKYLRNCRLTNVEQYGFERVVIFKFKTWAGEMRLYLELFGGGNVILVDEKGEILHALKYKRMRDRDILRGEPFSFPPPIGKNPLSIEKKEFVEALKDSGDVEVVRALVQTLSIGGFYAEEVLLRAAVEKKTVCKELGDSELDLIFDELHRLLLRITNGEFEPCIILDDNDGLLDVEPFRLEQYDGFKRRCYESFNEALDEFYIRIGTIEKALAVASKKVGSLEREVARLERIVERQERALVEAKAKLETNKRIGDAIYAHAGELKALLSKFLTGKKKGKEWSDIVSEVLAENETGKGSNVSFVSFDDKHLVINVDVNGLQFSLSLRRSLFDNAARFYGRYKRAKQKFKGAQTALDKSHRKLEETETRLKNLESVKEVRPVEVEENVSERKIKRKRWFEKFRWFISSDGLTVVAGKDAVSNEVLVNKYAEAEDSVFHADIVGAPFVVVKTEGKRPDEACLQQAAIFAASFSRGWREGFASVDVYQVGPGQLSKSAPSGEYVPRGGFVVRGKRNWIRGAPLKLAVGVMEQGDGRIRFVGGPVDSVEAQTEKYLTIVPGDLEGKALFKLVLKSLAKKVPKELQEKVLESSYERIREFIPYGKGRILEG